MRALPTVSLGLAIAVASCTPTTVCGCSPAPLPSVRVVGTVRAADGSALRTARITARTTRGACPGRGQVVLVGDAYLPPDDTGGRYELIASHLASEPDTLCVRVRAQRSVTASTDTLVSEPLTLLTREAPPYDSVRVDFRFR